MKLVFMGTPDFSVGALDALYQAGHEIVLVVTQPDKRKGRSGALSMSPVKEYALSHDLNVFQPLKVREETAVARLKETDADVFVVAAFGQILPQSVLDIPRYGCINIHASLLPRLRGAAPIQQAILDGEKETGITIMQMDAGCDTGDILLQEGIAITEEDTGGSLFDRLSVLGARLIVEALNRLEEGTLTAVKQDDARSTMTGKIDKASGRIDWEKDAAFIARSVRAYTPWPTGFTTLDGKTLKILKATAAMAEDVPETGSGMQPGSVVKTDKGALYVLTGDGVLKITEVQMEGKKRMRVHDFLLGRAVPVGTRLV